MTVKAPKTPQNAPTAMKATLRIPTTTYGFIECQFEGTEDEIIEQHNRLLKKYNGGFGLEPKVFDEIVEEYMSTRTVKNGTDLYDQMSVDQQQMLQILKRAFKRIDYQNKKK